MFETWSFSLRFLNVINALTILLEKLLCCSLSTCEDSREESSKSQKISVKKNHVKSVIEWVTVVAAVETGYVGGAAAVKRRCEG